MINRGICTRAWAARSVVSLASCADHSISPEDNLVIRTLGSFPLMNILCNDESSPVMYGSWALPAFSMAFAFVWPPAMVYTFDKIVDFLNKFPNASAFRVKPCSMVPDTNLFLVYKRQCDSKVFDRIGKMARDIHDACCRPPFDTFAHAVVMPNACERNWFSQSWPAAIDSFESVRFASLNQFIQRK